MVVLWRACDAGMYVSSSYIEERKDRACQALNLRTKKAENDDFLSTRSEVEDSATPWAWPLLVRFHSANTMKCSPV